MTRARTQGPQGTQGTRPETQSETRGKPPMEPVSRDTETER